MKKTLLWSGIMLLAAFICVGAIIVTNKYSNYSASQNQSAKLENQNSPNTEGDCLPEEEIAKMQTEIKTHNDAISTDTKYSDNGISIDFGNYGFKVIDDKQIGFGPWLLAGDPCPDGITQMYIMSFVDPKSKEDVISDVKNREFGTKGDPENLSFPDGLSFKEIIKINDFDTVVWESWGGYPTYSISFEIPGKDRNYLIETNQLVSGPEDYQKVIDILKTANIEK